MPFSSRLLVALLCAVCVHAHAEDRADRIARMQSLFASPGEEAQNEALRRWMNGEFGVLGTIDVFPPITTILQNSRSKRKDEKVLGQAMIHLATSYGPAANVLITTFVDIAEDEETSIYLRGKAIEALGIIGRNEPTVIEALIHRVEDSEPRGTLGVQDRAAEMLGLMGAGAVSAKPALERLLSHEFAPFHDSAFIALGRIAEEDLARPVSEQIERLANLKSVDASQASAAYLALELAGEKKDSQTQAAIGPLLEIVKTRDDVHLRAALRTLRRIGLGPKPYGAIVVAGAVVRSQIKMAAGILSAPGLSKSSPRP